MSTPRREAPTAHGACRSRRHTEAAVPAPIPSSDTNPVPAFLLDVFSEATLAESGSALVALAPTGEILWVNERWWALARSHGAESALVRYGPGASYFDGIAAPLRAHYEAVLREALRTRAPFEEVYECSSPAARRLYHFRALPLDPHGLLLEHSVAVEWRRAGAGAPPEAGPYIDEHGLIRQCSHCRRVARVSEAAWDLVRSVDATTAASVSHGICPTCVDYYWRPR